MSSQPNNLRINQEERRFLGVCAGVADYLDMPVVLVRIIFIISILTWPTLIIAYFALYFWLDRDLSTEKVSNWLSGSAPSRHFKNLDYRRPLYRNRRNRVIAGVCSGIADYLEVRPVLVRCVAVVAALILGPYAVLGYIICWFVMEPNPARRHSRKERRHNRRQRRHERRQAARGFSCCRVNRRQDDDLDEMADAAYREAMADMDDLYQDAKAESLYQPGAATIDLEKARRSGITRSNHARRSYNEKSTEECADVYYNLESRLRELEAFITSKKFRLHCEINRIR